MANPQPLFFEGVAIAAAHGLGNASPRLIRQDVQNLAVLPVRELAFAGGEEPPPHDQYCSIASQWLGVRASSPQTLIDWRAFAASPALYETGDPAVEKARMAVTRALVSFPDDETFAFLLGGVQAGLSILRPDIEEDVLAEDLEGLRDSMDDLHALYDRNGIPENARNNFIAHAYAILRLNNGGMGIRNLLRLWWTTGGASRLDVTTTPTPARVYVDGRDQQDSPAYVFVVPGARSVEAKAAGKHARKTVQVEANQILPLDLVLA